MFRKLVVIGLATLIIILAGLPAITAMLDHLGVIPLAQAIRTRYLTGTAIATIIALIILVPASYRITIVPWNVRCSVCGRRARMGSRYCAACGSRV